MSYRATGAQVIEPIKQARLRPIFLQGFISSSIKGNRIMTKEQPKYRLITRSDFDGLVCAILLNELGIVGEITFVHPKDMQDGAILVTANDILANVPYVEGCHLCFDHHASETVRIGCKARNHILDADADSTAHVVYDYYGGQKRFPELAEDIIEAVDKADSARFTREEILYPQGWTLPGPFSWFPNFQL
jgi:hypothetical protein